MDSLFNNNILTEPFSPEALSGLLEGIGLNLIVEKEGAAVYVSPSSKELLGISCGDKVEDFIAGTLDNEKALRKLAEDAHVSAAMMFRTLPVGIRRVFADIDTVSGMTVYRLKPLEIDTTENTGNTSPQNSMTNQRASS